MIIDRGNTAVKLAVVEEDLVLETVRADELSLEEACRLAEKYKICGAIYCSVRGIDARFAESFSRMTDAPLLIVTHRTAFPIGISYRTPETLGLDRVSACVGATALFPGESLLVVDAGTAITSDIVNKEGYFCGGNISPGLGLRFRSLHEFTSKLPEVSVEGDFLTFGVDTETAIRGGVLRGVISEIMTETFDAEKDFDTKKLILTGGDGEFLLEFLEHACDLEIIYEPDLMAIGLSRIFHYNEKNS